MKEEKVNTNFGDLEKLIELYDQNKIPSELERFVESSIQGKIFHRQETIERLKEFGSYFFEIIIIKKSVPLSEYQNFVSKVAKTQSKLVCKEKEESQDKIFRDMNHPMEYVKYLFPEYDDNLSFLRITKKSRELLERVAKLDNIKTPDEKIRDISDFFTNFSKNFGKGDIIGALHHLKVFVNNHQPPSNDKKDIFNKTINRAIPVIEEQDLRRNLILADSTEFGRNILRATNYTQSHIEQFCSYIHRLVHIKNHGNRKFKGKYYRYGSKKFWDRDFRKMCKQELKDFKKLKSFLIFYSKELKRLRNINAHHVPGAIGLSKDHKYLILQEMGKKRKTKENYHKLCETIISYSIFINKIGLHPESRYEPSEDTFGLLKFKRH